MSLNAFRLMVLLTIWIDCGDSSRDRSGRAKAKPGLNRLFRVDKKTEYEFNLNPVERQLQQELEKQTKRVNEDPQFFAELLKKNFMKLFHNNSGVDEEEQSPKFRSSKKTFDAGQKLKEEYGQIPDLFDLDNGGEADILMKEQNCDKAFQYYFEQASKGTDTFIKRSRMKLRGNLSEEENWTKFFNQGDKGTYGHPLCFVQGQQEKTNKLQTMTLRQKKIQLNSGPCAKVFENGSDCPYYPDVPFLAKLYPACCDKEGCFCECTYLCATKTNIFTLLESSVISMDYDECSYSINSTSEGFKWKTDKCKATEKKGNYFKIDEKCRSKNSTILCVGQAYCIKDFCKVCYRWQCTDEMSTAEKKKLELSKCKFSASDKDKEKCDAVTEEPRKEEQQRKPDRKRSDKKRRRRKKANGLRNPKKKCRKRNRKLCTVKRHRSAVKRKLQVPKRVKPATQRPVKPDVNSTEVDDDPINEDDEDDDEEEVEDEENSEENYSEDRGHGNKQKVPRK